MKPKPIEERVATSVAEAYGDAQTAMVMAKSEAWALRGFLEQHARSLRKEADEIDQFLAQSTEQTDSWYEEIVARQKAAGRM